MPKYYLLDENKNLVEVVNIEDNLFRTRLEKLHSEVNNTDHNIEFVTQAQYNQLEHDGELVANTYYFITDDTTVEDLEEHINQNDEAVASAVARVEAIEDGTTPAQKSTTTSFTNNNMQRYVVGNIGYVNLPTDRGFYYLLWDNGTTRNVNFGVVEATVGTHAFAKDYDGNEYILVFGEGATLYRKTNSETTFTPYSNGYIWAKEIK